MEESNIFYGKTEDEAIEEGLRALGITLAEAEITVLEEGKKKLFGATKWKISVRKSVSDAKRAAEFIDGLLEKIGISAVSDIVSEEENIKIDIKTTSSARVIGKRGDVLDAIQTLAGTVANIGKDEYKKVVVDCENYRSQREETLKALADKVAAKAVEKGRKIILEPMNPYERRIIHSALAGNSEVKTASEGREPIRYIVIIPNNAQPGDRGLKYGERRERGDRGSRGRNGDRRERGRGERRDRGDRPARSAGGAKRGKKEIHFGTFLGNSGAKETEQTPELETEE